MKFTISEVGAANLFIMARGRSGSTQLEDRDVLVNMLREFGYQGVVMGLNKAKELFRESTDAKGGCRVMSEGYACNCFLCKADRELEAAACMQGKG